MRLNACIAGVGMTRFMKYPDKGLKELGTEAVGAAFFIVTVNTPFQI